MEDTGDEIDIPTTTNITYMLLATRMQSKTFDYLTKVLSCTYI